MIGRRIYFAFRIIYRIDSWFRRRFTLAGLFVLGGLAASLILGVDTRQTLAHQIFSFLLSLLSISILCSVFFRVRLTAVRLLPRFGTVGEPLVYRIKIQNQTPIAQRGLSLFEELDRSLPPFEEFVQAKEPGEETRNWFDRSVGYPRWRWLISQRRGALEREHLLSTIPPRSELEVRLEIIPIRRGHLSMEGITVSRQDPFGLIKSLIGIPQKQSVLILPKRYPIPSVQLPGTRKYQHGGMALTSQVGDSEEFVSLREYRPGDPLRRLHWKSWARIGKPMVKEYQNEFFVRHALILDTFLKAPHSELFEEAVSVAASFACSIQSQESLLDLLFVGTEAYCFTSGRGLAHTEQMLEILASVRTCTEKPFGALRRLVMERVSALSGCICILVSWDEERKRFIQDLKALRLPLWVFVVSDPKIDKDVDSIPACVDPECFHRLEVGKIAEGLARL